MKAFTIDGDDVYSRGYVIVNIWHGKSIGTLRHLYHHTIKFNNSRSRQYIEMTQNMFKSIYALAPSRYDEHLFIME